MAHALGGNFGRHTGLHHPVQPGGWWTFGLVALVATGIGVALVQSPLFRASSGTPDSASSPAIIFLETQVTSTTGTGPEGSIPALSAAVPAVEPAPAAPSSEASRATVAPVTAALAQRGGSIREVDLTTVPFLQTLVRQLAGRVDPAQVKYEDVTLDGNEDAIVPITSDGSYGNLGYVVFRLKNGTPEQILVRRAGPERRGLVLTYDRGQLAETSGIYGPTDANCCPTEIQKTYYRWTGQTLILDRTETITIPQGPKAD